RHTRSKRDWSSDVCSSDLDPIVPPQWPWLYHLMRLSPWVGRGVMALATKKLDKLMQPVFELRAELGLPRGEQPIFGGQHSPTKRSEERRVGKSVDVGGGST